MAAEAASKKAEREALRGVIQQWNANRLDLFELSEPNEVSFFFLLLLSVTYLFCTGTISSSSFGVPNNSHFRGPGSKIRGFTPSGRCFSVAALKNFQLGGKSNFPS